MPELLQPPIPSPVNLDDPWVQLYTSLDEINQDEALHLVSDSFTRYEMWRTNNCDQRWRLNEWLYYGYVPGRTWEGTSVARSSLPVQIAFDQVESAHAKLFGALLGQDEVFGVTPWGDTSPDEAEMISDRLYYLLDNNLDDFGWTARAELSLTLRDFLIYGNCFGLIEWDEGRRQSTVCRIDPRDVYMDPSAQSPYIEKVRSYCIRKLMTVDELIAMRAIPGVKIPTDAVLNYMSQNRETVMADRSRASQEAGRGYRYNPPYDDAQPMPSARYIEVLIYQGQGREIWTLNRQWTMINILQPYGCTRLVSAPCFPVPNRFYAQSYVDILDPIQQGATALLNRHMDEMALALNPPRATKSGITRTPSSLSWRPGLVNEYADPKNDVVVFQPQGITQNVWQTIAFFEQQAEKRTGQSSLATSGLARPGNANRTRGGMAMQMQAPAERLGAIAANFENFFLVPMLYKMLRVEKVHAEGDVYGRRNGRSQRVASGSSSY